MLWREWLVGYIIFVIDVREGWRNGGNVCGSDKVIKRGVSEQVFFLDIVQRNCKAYGRIHLDCEGVSESEPKLGFQF